MPELSTPGVHARYCGDTFIKKYTDEQGYKRRTDSWARTWQITSCQTCPDLVGKTLFILKNEEERGPARDIHPTRITILERNKSENADRPSYQAVGGGWPRANTLVNHPPVGMIGRVLPELSKTIYYLTYPVSGIQRPCWQFSKEGGPETIYAKGRMRETYIGTPFFTDTYELDDIWGERLKSTSARAFASYVTSLPAPYTPQHSFKMERDCWDNSYRLKHPSSSTPDNEAKDFSHSVDSPRKFRIRSPDGQHVAKIVVLDINAPVPSVSPVVGSTANPQDHSSAVHTPVPLPITANIPNTEDPTSNDTLPIEPQSECGCLACLWDFIVSLITFRWCRA